MAGLKGNKGKKRVGAGRKTSYRNRTVFQVICEQKLLDRVNSHIPSRKRSAWIAKLISKEIDSLESRS
ncbi:MAG: hypothetical protein ACRC2R_15815 [Xenococcaceae cyanobacterium]